MTSLEEIKAVDQTAHGRLVSKDDRDKKYLLPRLAAAKERTFRYWNTPKAYDQGDTSMCVAYAGVRYLASGPILNKPLPFEQLYRECQDNDEWPGNDYDGTSVRGLFKALKARGLVGEYSWGVEVGPVVDHLLLNGPVVFGTTWTDEMANPTKWGYITLGDLASSTAGHGWCAVGANKEKKNPDGTKGAIKAVNSWGPDWGPLKGAFWVTFKDLAALIEADGEAGVATEIRYTERA